MKFEKVKLKDLIFSTYNPRKKLTPKDDEYKKIKASINEFGYVDPIIVNSNNVIVGGFQRGQVLKELGYKEIDIVRIDISPEKEKALNIALNKISGEWDFTKLTGLLKEIKSNNEDDFFLTGFDMAQFDELLKEYDKELSGGGGEAAGDSFDADKAKEEMGKPISKPGILYKLEKLFLLCGDSKKAEDVTRLLKGGERVLMFTAPPYGVSYDPAWREGVDLGVGERSKGKVKNDDIIDWSLAYTLFPGDIAYVWHAGIYGHIVAKNLIDCGYQIKAQIIWAKQHFALSSGNFNWQHEPCQPAGTIISTPSGQIPIEKLKDGDRVITYNSYSSSIIGKRKGFKIKTSKRFYNGDMFNIFVGNKNTKTTDNHKFTTRFSNDCDSKYGIPTTIWELARPRKGIPENLNWRSEEQIKWIYSMLDLDLMFLNVLKMLKDFNKRIEFPMVTKEETQYKPFGRNKTKLINACNLFEDIMCIPVPHNSGDSFDWIKISKIKISKFEDFVYSLDVDKYEHYIADGIVTHNCLYVVKNKKKHNWQGVNNASTIWNIKNNNSFGNSDKEQTYGHGTQKPIECMLKPINYNSCPGQAVYDPFLGSGTSLIASEQSGRICYGMEIDPIYCDVILQRYIDLTYIRWAFV